MKRLVLSAALLLGATVMAQGGEQWRTERTASAIDDTVTVKVTTDSAEPLSCNDGKPATLIFECRGETTRFEIRHGCKTMGEYSRVFARVRLGEEGAEDWRFHTNAPFDWMGYVAGAEPSIMRMMDFDRFAVAFRPDGGREEIAAFDTSGIAQAIRPVREQCGW